MSFQKVAQLAQLVPNGFSSLEQVMPRIGSVSSVDENQAIPGNCLLEQA